MLFRPSTTRAKPIYMGAVRSIREVGTCTHIEATADPSLAVGSLPWGDIAPPRDSLTWPVAFGPRNLWGWTIVCPD